MEEFNIKVSNQTQQNNIFKIYFLCMAPILGLFIYQQKYPIIQLEKNTELILIMAIFIIPSLFLALKLKSQTSAENVSFNQKTILTKLQGPINIDEITVIKSPKDSDWDKDSLKIKLKNGEKIIFSPIVKQFNNKKNKIAFENFFNKFENTLN